MTYADNHSILLEGARNAGEYNSAMQTAINASISEEYSAVDVLESLNFSDGSTLTIIGFKR